MEEELNEHELEEQFYSMLHYVDDTQADIATNQNALNIIENAPRSTVRRYWRTNEDHTPVNTSYQKVNIPKEAPQPKDDTKPKEEKSKPSAQPSHLSLFQQPVPKNIRKTIEIIENENANVVELESSDEDEVIEVALPPKPTIMIESSDDDDVTIKTMLKSKPIEQEKTTGHGEREVSASPVPSVVSSISDEFIRGDCIALNISSRTPDNHSFDFGLHGPDLIGSTPSKKKKKKKNKESATSTPINVDTTPTKSNNVEECFATPKSKAKNKKQRNKSYAVTEKSIPNADVYDSDSNQSIIEINKNKNTYTTNEKSLPSADVYESDSNPSETVKGLEKQKETPTKDLNSSASSIVLEIHSDETLKTSKDSPSQFGDSITIDLTDISGLESDDIGENIVMGNVTGFEESDDYGEEAPIVENQKFGSTKVPAILYENLDFDNLKGKEKVCKNGWYSLTSLRAEMEKFYNESWGGEDFNHREIQKSMSRDKSLWAIDPKDRMSSFSRKKFNVTCNYCNRAGHRDDMCRLKPPVCYMCGNMGHMEPRCPRKICVNCGSPNQMYSTMCRNCAHWGRVRCVECGQHGHPPTHCPDLWRRYHNTIEAASHLEENRFTKKHYQLYCSGCTRRGHLVHSCRVALPFSGLPLNSPYVLAYRPVYPPTPPTPPTPRNQHQRNPPRNNQQDDTISSASKESHKRQSKSPTAHETHVNKKRNLSMSESELAKQNPKSPTRQENQRKRSQSKEPIEDNQRVTETSAANVESAPDFIPIVSSNHDKKGHVIQDNEVSDTSDVITSARIYVTNDIIEKLKSKEGEDWLKETTDKLKIAVENTEVTSFLSIKGKVGDQDAFQSALREWTKPKMSPEHAKSDNEADVSQLSENDTSFTDNIPKNRNNVLRKLSKALESLKDNIGEPNALFKELNYLQGRHQQLLKQKVINPQQLTHNRDHIHGMLKKLNMILIGQAGLANGSSHIRELYTLQSKLISYRQKNISAQLRKEIGEHFQCIFTAIPRSDYRELIMSYNHRQIKLPIKKKKKSFTITPKKFNTIPQQNKTRSPGAEIKPGIEGTKAKIITSETPRNPLVEKTMNKLVFFHRRLMQARTNDTVLKKTRVELVKKLHSHIASFNKTANMSSKNLKKIKKLQEQARLFLNNV